MRRWLFGSACMVVGILVGISVRDVPVAAQVECAQRNGDVDGNGKLAIADALLILQYIFNPEAQRPDLVPHCVHPLSLPATGQTKCYSAVDPWEEIDCASVGYPGQDGYYQAGCPTEGRFVDNGDGTVTDNCTGLMWQQATADINRDGVGDDSDSAVWQQALQYCEDLEFAGYTDWRLPNVRELSSIVDYGRWASAIDPVFDVCGCRYWSSSGNAGIPTNAYTVSFENPQVYSPGKDNDGGVRAVRGGL